MGRVIAALPGGSPPSLRTLDTYSVRCYYLCGTGPRRGRSHCDASPRRLTQVPTPATPESRISRATRAPRCVSQKWAALRLQSPRTRRCRRRCSPPWTSPKGAAELGLEHPPRGMPLACGPLPHAMLRAGRTVRSEAPPKRNPSSSAAKKPAPSPFGWPLLAPKSLEQIPRPTPRREPVVVLPVGPVSPLRWLPSVVTESGDGPALQVLRGDHGKPALPAPKDCRRLPSSAPQGLSEAAPLPSPKGRSSSASSSPKGNKEGVPFPVLPRFFSEPLLGQPRKVVPKEPRRAP